MFLALKRMAAAGTLTEARLDAAISTGRLSDAQADELRALLPGDPGPVPDETPAATS